MKQAQPERLVRSSYIRLFQRVQEVRGGFEPPNNSFADCSLSHLGTAPSLPLPFAPQIEAQGPLLMGDTTSWFLPLMLGQ